MLYYDIYESPIGKIYVVVSDNGVRRIDLFTENWLKYFHMEKDLQRNKQICHKTIIQLDEYFSGKRKEFNLKLDIKGTAFQKKVWKVLQKIPYGKTLTYKQVAQILGNPKAVRAVGQANKANQIPIVIPCHRVIGKNKLLGFSGSKTWYKEYLLRLEGYLI